MRVVLAQPPVRDFYFTPHRAAGLGMHSMAGAIRCLGVETTVLNFSLAGGKPAVLPLPENLHHLRPVLITGEKGPLCFWGGYKRFGPSFETCAEAVAACGPDALFLSSFAFAYADDSLELASAVKKLMPELFICVGGAGVSAWPEYYLRGGQADAAAAGDGEAVAGPLIAALLRKDNDFSGVPNLYWKRDGNVVRPALRIEVPEEELEFAFAVSGRREGAAVLTTSLTRGCPKACKFCSVHLSQGRGFRRLPVEKIESFLNAGPAETSLPSPGIPSPESVGAVNFEDDNLLFDWAYGSRVLDAFSRRFPKAAFLAENGLDYTLLTPEIIARLARYGLSQFNISLGTLDSAALAAQNRNGSIRRYEEVIREACRHGIPAISYLIAGLPDDTADSAGTALAYLAGVKTLPGLSMFYAVPGLESVPAEMLRQKVIDRGSHVCAGSSAFPWNGSLSTRELATAFRLARFVYALKTAEAGLIRNPETENLLNLVLKEKKLYTLKKRKAGLVPVPVDCAEPGMERAFFSGLGYFRG